MVDGVSVAVPTDAFNWTVSGAANVVGFVVAFVISFYFCSSTIIYALMRRKVDDIDMSRVYTPLEQVGRGDSDSSDPIRQPTPASDNDDGAS